MLSHLGNWGDKGDCRPSGWRMAGKGAKKLRKKRKRGQIKRKGKKKVEGKGEEHGTLKYMQTVFLLYSFVKRCKNG